MNNINLKSSSRLKKIFCCFLLAVLMGYNNVSLAEVATETEAAKITRLDGEIKILKDEKTKLEAEKDTLTTDLKTEKDKEKTGWDSYWVIGLGIALVLAVCLAVFLFFTRKNEDEE